MAELQDAFMVEELYGTDLPVGAKLSWLQTLRAKAKAHYSRVGLPTIKDEEWRYTNLTELKATPFSIANNGVPSVALAAVEHSRLVFVDGIFSPSLSTIRVADGLTVRSMAEALEHCPERLENHFNRLTPDTEDQHGFTALNTAYFDDGYVVLLEPNTVIEEPIECLFVASKQSQPVMSHVRNLVVLGHHSQCTLVERFVSQQDLVYLTNTVTEIVAEVGAHCDHYKIQQESDAAFHVGGLYVRQDDHAQVTTHNVTLTGMVTRNDIVSDLVGAGAHVEMNGLVIGHGRQHIDSFTQVNHRVAHTTSDEYYKTVLDDASRAIFRGRIVVAQDAQKTVADQTNNNLLLSEKAEADSKPQLEIYADDVKCSHGATVGQLDAKSLFYLNSRGLSDASARALLTFAFANQVIERVRVESIREELTELIAGELLDGLSQWI